MLTKKQLKELIAAIYASKAKYDVKCRDDRLPRETMEQHMYTFLNQRYGLRPLIVAHVTAIIRALNRFAADDNDVCVFGRILRNEVEEEFRHVQTRLRETVVDVLRVFLKGKNPRKTDGDIDDMLAARMQTVVAVDEWTEVVNYLYEPDDAAALSGIVDARIRDDPDVSNARIVERRRRELEMEAQGRRVRKTAEERAREEAEDRQEGDVNFDSFLQLVLNFQLRTHEKFLARFRRAFRNVDTDKNGIVDEVQFRALVRTLDPSKTDEQVTDLLAHADPHHNDHVTFSDAVHVLLNASAP
jgi:Ca2+-binding EF-hand superfamily protein